MNLKERGLYVDILALAWDSEEPGTISMSLPQICRELRVFSATLQRLLTDFPTTLQKVGDKFIQPKLHQQWLELKEFIEKKSLAGKKGNAVRWHTQSQPDRPAFASASASASAQSKDNPALTHSKMYHQEKRRVLASREAAYGSGPSDHANLGGFKVHTCEDCGQQYHSKQRHSRECKPNVAVQ